ncbi:putative aldolase class 2 protein PA3430 [Antedon mediterranea]|uniref:putative aldolase class 2 protein PA3430 n=1 Tax=Antedon mediterranea TaxID=105859 RepID=UPI003AF4F970
MSVGCVQKLLTSLYRWQCLNISTRRMYSARPRLSRPRPILAWERRSHRGRATWSEEASCVEMNKQQREELAAAYQALDSFGLSEGINNHLSTKAPARNGKGEVILLFPYGLHWNEVTASRLVGVDMASGTVVEGVGEPETTAVNIHCQVYQEALKSGSSINTVFHLHTPYCSALSCLQDPTLRMIHQNSARFFGDVAYDDGYEGLAMDTEEGCRLARIMSGKSVLIMGNHGILVTDKTVARAFNTTYYLERAAMVQILAMSSGAKLSELDDAGASLVRTQIMANYTKDSTLYFEAIKRLIRIKSPYDYTE